MFGFILDLFPWFQDKEDPFYTVNLGRVLQLHDMWRECLPQVHPFFAVKCNTDPALLETLACLGCGFDCASKVGGCVGGWGGVVVVCVCVHVWCVSVDRCVHRCVHVTSCAISFLNFSPCFCWTPCDIHVTTIMHSLHFCFSLSLPPP